MSLMHFEKVLKLNNALSNNINALKAANRNQRKKKSGQQRKNMMECIILTLRLMVQEVKIGF